jgi:tetratricopeptide (TPR) repeat protein
MLQDSQLGEAADERLDHSFTRSFFRPYFDLGPAPPDGPYHLAGIEFFFRSLVEDETYPHIQACFNPSFRETLIRDTGLYEYDVESPAELDESLKSARWKMLCELIDSFDALPCRSQTRLAWTLSKLCFQRVAVDLIPPSCSERVGESDELAGLAFVRCYSRYRMSVDDPSAPSSASEFEQLATESAPGINRIDATYQMVVQNVKHAGDVERAEAWQALHLRAIRESRSELDDFTYLFVMSRYHRVGGFIPQMRRQAKAVVDEMELAERYALELPRRDEVHRIAADEVLYPVLESRIKEALWLKDNDLALERAERLVKLSPSDSRAWLQLGEVQVERERPEEALRAYRNAARFAPPGREIAWFMAGQCHEALDDLESACDAYLTSLEIDPFGIAAAELLQNAAQQLGHTAILRWVQPRLARLESLRAVAQPPRAWPYKHFPSP